MSRRALGGDQQARERRVGVFAAGIDLVDDELHPMGLDRSIERDELRAELVLQCEVAALALREHRPQLPDAAVLAVGVGILLVAVENLESLDQALALELDDDPLADALARDPLDPGGAAIAGKQLLDAVGVAQLRRQDRARAIALGPERAVEVRAVLRGRARARRSLRRVGAQRRLRGWRGRRRRRGRGVWRCDS